MDIRYNSVFFLKTLTTPNRKVRVKQKRIFPLAGGLDCLLYEHNLHPRLRYS